MYDLKNLPGTMRAQITGAGLPLKTIGTQFSDLDHSPVMDEVQEWLENVRNGHIVQSVGEANCGVGLILAGEAGHGKTTLAATAGWAENTFDALLRSRFNAGLPTIVTTNVAFENWGGVYGEPMGSFAHEAFIPLTVTSTIGDRRK